MRKFFVRQCIIILGDKEFLGHCRVKCEVGMVLEQGVIIVLVEFCCEGVA